MNKNWDYGILNDAVLKESSNISLNKIEKEKGKYPVFGAKGFAKNVSFYQQEKEYLAIIKDGAGIGRVSKHPAKSSVLATMQYILPKKNYDINFIKYFLESLDFENYRTGSTIPHIYYKDYKNAAFPLVSLSEQQQIVAILDQAFEAIDQAKANIEKNIRNAKELFQSKLNAIFSQRGEGWEEKRFKDVCVLQRGFDLPTRLREQGKYDLVTSSGITDSHSEFKVKGPGVVTGRSGSIGNVFYIENNFWPLNTSLYIKDFKNNLVKYVYYFIRAFDLSKYATGTGVPTLNRNFVHDEKVLSTNDINEQKRVFQLLDELESQTNFIIKQYQNQLYNVEDLKKSILQKAFAGELTEKTVEV